MIQKPLYVIDEIGNVVTKVSAILLPQLQVIDSNIQGVQYYFGHIKEIIETLGEKDESRTQRFQKYPAICLLMDFAENMGKGLGIASTVKLHLCIICSTENTLKANERYEQNFKPILYPIYNTLIDQLYKSKSIMAAAPSQILHTKIDRPYWGQKGLGTIGTNVFNDYIDAIEITELQLKFYNPKC